MSPVTSQHVSLSPLTPNLSIANGRHSEVKVFKTKEIDVAKLFSKHFKLAEHAEYLDKTKVGIAVGTPNRIGKLLSDTGAPRLNVVSASTRHAYHSQLQSLCT